MLLSHSLSTPRNGSAPQRSSPCTRQLASWATRRAVPGSKPVGCSPCCMAAKARRHYCIATVLRPLSTSGRRCPIVMALINDEEPARFLRTCVMELLSQVIGGVLHVAAVAVEHLPALRSTLAIVTPQPS